MRIAEDDEISSQLIAIATEPMIKEVIHVRSGKDAVVACLNNPDIDLVLMDIQMPLLDGVTEPPVKLGNLRKRSDYCRNCSCINR